VHLAATAPQRPAAGRRPHRRPNATRLLVVVLTAPLSGCTAAGWAARWPDAAVVLGAAAVMTLTWLVAARSARPPREYRWGRHVVVHLPMLAPERYCACGACGQLAAPGAWLADWHYDVPGVLPPTKAPDATPIRGLAWTWGPAGWEPAIVYVLPPDAHARPPRGAPSTNGQATVVAGHGPTLG